MSEDIERKIVRVYRARKKWREHKDLPLARRKSRIDTAFICDIPIGEVKRILRERGLF